MAERPSISFDPSKIFPLRLSPFEEYFFVDSRRRFPMTENIVWLFGGRVEPRLLEKALRRAAASEPLLFARVKKRGGRYYWIFPETAAEISLPLSETAESVRALKSGSLPLDRFDLSAEPPVRFRLTVGPDGFLIHTAVHHALTDGIGMTRFVGNWFSFYEEELQREKETAESPARLERAAPPGNNTADDGAPNETPDPLLLRERENFHVELPEKVSLWSGLYYTISETFLWFCRRPLNLTPLFRGENLRTADAANEQALPTVYPPTPDSPSPAGDELPRMFWQSLPERFLEAYHRRAKTLGVSVNSLLTRDIAAGFARWYAAKKKSTRSARRFRFLIPTNLRNRHHLRMPVANMIGYVFLDRFPQECGRSEQFLLGIETQMREIRKWSAGLFFLDGLRFFRNFPGALRLLTSRFFCHSSAVFSNVGILCRTAAQPKFRNAASIFVEGECELLRIVGSPPVRPNTPIAIGAIAHGDTLIVTFCVDQSTVAAEERDRLIFFIMEEIRQSAGEANA